MPHAISEGLSQERIALTPRTLLHIERLQKRNVTQILLDKYGAKDATMQEVVAKNRGKKSDKKQLTEGEEAARSALLVDIQKVQNAAKQTYPVGSPQGEEFFVNERHNYSTAKLIKWAKGIQTSYPKYSAVLNEKAGLIQEDVDKMVADAQALSGIDANQETAVRIDCPESTAEVQKAMKEVSDIADFIYTAARLEFANEPAILGQFEALRPLRFSTPPREVPDDGQSTVQPAS